MREVNPAWTILMLTVPQRSSNFNHLAENILNQIGDKPIELIGVYDNRSMTVGHKRNSALKIANGDYVCFIDDDDQIADSYVEEIWEAISKNGEVDVIVFDSICEDKAKGLKIHCRYGLEHNYMDAGTKWTGKPAHTHVWRSELARRCSFPDSMFKEDISWAKEMSQIAETQYRINSVLYYYMFDPDVSLTRGR